LPDELQALCYEINHKKSMREVLEEMKENIFDEQLSNHEGLGVWVYTLACRRNTLNRLHIFDPPQSGSRTITVDYEDYYEYYGCDDNYYTDEYIDSD
jgi:hypothetical protein